VKEELKRMVLQGMLHTRVFLARMGRAECTLLSE